MGQVLIRGLDKAIVEKLKLRAHQNGRSVEAELRVILTNVVQPDAAQWRQEIDQIRKMFSGRKFSDSTKLIREDRKLR